MKFKPYQSLLAWLMHYANADPSYNKKDFYGLKDKLLKRYATQDGYDIQEIIKECHGGFDYYGDPRGCPGEECRRCNGTGIYDRKWIRLERWRWGKYIFHIPIGHTYVKPESVQIRGLVKHADYGRKSREAELWLYLVTFQFSTLWKKLTRCCYKSPGWFPMCRLQKIAMNVSMKLHRERCWCGKKFFTWGSGLYLCRKCRKPETVLQQDNEVPF